MKVLVSILFILPLCISAQQKIDIEKAKEYVRKEVTICDTIHNAIYVQSSYSKPTLLNMGGTYPNHKFTIVIANADRDKYPSKPEQLYSNKYVCVTGTVELYDGKPQVHVSRPTDIVIMGEVKGPNRNMAKVSAIKTDNTIPLSAAREVREGPGNSFPIIERLQPGTSIKVISTNNEWSLITFERYSTDQRQMIAVKGFIKNKVSKMGN